MWLVPQDAPSHRTSAEEEVYVIRGIQDRCHEGQFELIVPGAEVEEEESGKEVCTGEGEQE